MSTRDEVRRFIVENFYVADAAVLGDDASLIDGGWIDSTGMLELIAHLESAYDVRIEDDEMTPANLDSIERIAAFVARKRGAVPAMTG